MNENRRFQRRRDESFSLDYRPKTIKKNRTPKTPDETFVPSSALKSALRLISLGILFNDNNQTRR